MSAGAAIRREPWPSVARQREGVSFGVWVFLASEIMFFGALLTGYAVYRTLYPHAFAIASRETEVVYGTVNTAILLTSSLSMAIAAKACERSLRRLGLAMLGITVLLGLAFLVVKGFEYRDDLRKGLFPGPGFPLQPPEAELFWSFYWIMTGVHALHLAVGIGAVTVVMVLLARRAVPTQATTFEGVALYWHLVDLIWIVLLPILYLVSRT